MSHSAKIQAYQQKLQEVNKQLIRYEEIYNKIISGDTNTDISEDSKKLLEDLFDDVQGWDIASVIPKFIKQYDEWKDKVVNLGDVITELMSIQNGNDDTTIGHIETLEEMQEEYQKLNKYIVDVDKGMSSLKNQVTDYTKKLEENGKETEFFKEKLSGLKAECDELDKKIKDGTATEEEEKKLENLQKVVAGVSSKISDLKNEHDNLTNSIEDTKKAIDELQGSAENIADTFSDMVSAQDDLQKVSDEVATGNEITLSTLSSLQKKYPQLIDLINDYVNGRKTEADIIKAMTDIYNDDVINYNNSVIAKSIKSESFYKTLLDNNANLINDYKEKYNIDLTNYKTYSDAKIAIEENAQKKIKAIQDIEGATAYMYQGTLKHHTYQSLSGENKQIVDNALQQLGISWDDYLAGNYTNTSSFSDLMSIANGAKKTELDDVYKAFADKFVSSYSGVEVTGINKNDNKNNTGSGNSGTSKESMSDYVSEYLKWIDRQKNLGKMSVEQEIEQLKSLNNYKQKNAEDSYQISYRLYQAETKLQDEKNKQLQDQLNLAYEAYDKLVNDRIDKINKETEAYKNATDKRIQAIDDEIAARKRLNEDADRQKEIDAINAQLNYAQLDDLSRRELERKKQDLLNEQAEIDWERTMQTKKDNLSSDYNNYANKNNEAIQALQSAAESAKNYFDKLSGNQSNRQIVNNNSDTRNIQIIQNALSDKQMNDKIIKALYDK